MSDKAKRSPSQNAWYAIAIDSNKELVVVKGQTQKEIKRAFSENPDYDLQTLIRGKMFSFKVQKTFEFIDAPNELVEVTPPPSDVL